MLHLSGLRITYGAITAVHDLTLDVHPGEIVALIGANGAGKSSTLRAISGLITPQAGRITFEGQDITGLRPDRITARGLSQVPEGRAVLARLSVLDNLLMGAYARHDNDIAIDLQRVLRRFPRLDERQSQRAGTLSGGEQQMLVMGRALMARPRLLMLDEPSMGLAPLVVAEVFQLIRDMHQQGTTILLVEQNARQALNISHRAYVLETGHLAISGPAATLAADPRVISAYLGGPRPES